MAQYTVKSGCGHTATVSLSGPMRERERRIAWMQSPAGKCNSCYAAVKRQEEDSQERKAIDELKANIQKSGTLSAEQVTQIRGQIASNPEDFRAKRMATALNELGY